MSVISRSRRSLAVAALGAVLSPAAVACGGSSSEPSGESTPADAPTPVRYVHRLRINKRAIPVGGIRTITVRKGDRVRLGISSAVADEIHVHGYDLIKDVPAGGSVDLSFPATSEGSFEIELEKRGRLIAQLDVRR